MITTGVRVLLLFQGVAFIAASLVHFGVLMSGYEHSEAGTAESVIGIVLLGGLVIGFLRPSWSRISALAVQIFALLGTFVGLFTIAIGIGPRTAPDLMFHAFLVAILVIGLVLTARSRKEEGRNSEMHHSAHTAH